jgi:predicted nucleic acid-binding protein
MNELISIDSAGWIERFTEGPKASEFNQMIDQCEPKQIVTSTTVVYEVYKKIKKTKGERQALLAIAALNQTTIVPIDQTIAVEAADYSIEFNLHFSDALVYATARHYKAKLYTSDSDLRQLKNVCFI